MQPHLTVAQFEASEVGHAIWKQTEESTKRSLQYTVLQADWQFTHIERRVTGEMRGTAIR